MLIVSAFEEDYFKEYETVLGEIFQSCPVVVPCIERYTPELIPKLFPIQSLPMCVAIYAQKEMKITNKLAFITH